METIEHGPEELVVDRKTGLVRQAGATTPEGQYVLDFRDSAERSLFIFAKGVLGLSRLNRQLHREGCLWLQRKKPARKLMLWPRDHNKTAIVGRALPIHILIQPEDNNIYIPGLEGASTRILLANETATNAEHQLRWIQNKFEGNEILRALWPHRCWSNARRESRKWSEKEMILPRSIDFPEGSIETIGVGGAVVGRHYNVMIKDDLISLDAANSSIVMQNAVEWHQASRALFDDVDNDLEFIIGTRWAVHDLYSYIMDNDPSVDCITRRAVEDGLPIYPEMFSLDSLNQLKRELGPRFYLLYMNSAENPELTDLNMSQVRYYKITASGIAFSDEERDLTMAEPDPEMDHVPSHVRGMPLNKDTYDQVFTRKQFIRRDRPR